ncbi:hypothetical protein CDAR_50381 [Caerostris darwini]|uniref:Uncharacterized protein n=1 Tax=Caerostris darwini TaxID=1538125 RepID=A0AAV4UXD8_9ARAC|nr:hypothetical protein CDAR_50381 [Caerostris darwini]
MNSYSSLDAVQCGVHGNEPVDRWAPDGTQMLHHQEIQRDASTSQSGDAASSGNTKRCIDSIYSKIESKLGHHSTALYNVSHHTCN